MNYSNEFNPETATKSDIELKADALVGKRLSEVLRNVSVRERAPGDKGQVGQLVERYFRIAQNSDSEPDFKGSGIELKVVPIVRKRKGARAKERTSLTMIDFTSLEKETWESASVRHKLNHILFVFYEHVSASEAETALILAYQFWCPGLDLIPQIVRDWTVVHNKVASGYAHTISEGDGRVLGAATKGAGHGKLVSQPRSETRARPRAWALKSSLTTWIYESTRQVPQLSVAEALGIAPGEDFEAATLRRLDTFRGMQLGDVAAQLGVVLGRSKSWAAQLVRRAIGIHDDRLLLREFEQLGISIKTVPISPLGKAWEAMSFPRFVHNEIVNQRWESSDFLSSIQRLLIIPLMRTDKKYVRENQIWGRPFFWSPDDANVRDMRADWLRIIRMIRQGQSDKLPSYRLTRAIHVRPHGRNSLDTELAPGGITVTKKSLWLNPSLIERIVNENHGLNISR